MKTFFYLFLIFANNAKPNRKIRAKRQSGGKGKGIPSRLRVPIGVDERESVNDVYYSPKYIEKLEAHGIDTAGFLKANKTSEDSFAVSICRDFNPEI